MSLTRIALRIAAVEAVKGRTLVGANVLDTPNGALDIQADGSLRTGEEKSFIAVYTDQGLAENVTGRSLIENGACVITFEIGLSSAMLERDQETGAAVLVGINIPATDRNWEFYLDIVQRQITDALTDPENAWAEVFRGLHYEVLKIEFAGARNADDGQKLAGHQLRLTVALADDPLKGEELAPGSTFLAFLAALEGTGDAVYLEQAETMRALLSGSDMPWLSLQRRHGMTAAELLALGHGPLADDDDRSAPEMESGTVEVDGLVSVTVDEP